MIVPIILDPENITREYFDKNKPSFELFRLALEKNLVLIFDKEEKLKEELNKNLIELNNPPSTNTLLFYNTFIDLIYKNHLKYILSESQFKEEDILDFAVKSHRDLKFMDSLLTNKKITKILDFETCKIEDIMDTNFYTYVQKYSKGLPKTIDKLVFDIPNITDYQLLNSKEFGHHYFDMMIQGLSYNLIKLIQHHYERLFRVLKASLLCHLKEFLLYHFFYITVS